MRSRWKPKLFYALYPGATPEFPCASFWKNTEKYPRKLLKTKRENLILLKLTNII